MYYPVESLTINAFKDPIRINNGLYQIVRDNRIFSFVA